MNTDAYRLAPLNLTLPPGEIHIWRAWLAERNDLGELDHTLWEDERRRAERFHFEADRQRFVAARGILRRLLGRYLRVAPAEVSFRYGAQGKPELSGSATSSVSFNLAHSGDLALFALAQGRRLGIDVERLREVPEALTIARHHFTPSESKHLRSTGTGLQAAFFRLWTRKEAVIKAVGTGVSTPLHEFDVSSIAPADARWQRVSVPSQPRPEWYVCDLPAADNYCAALAVEVSSMKTGALEEPARLYFWREGD